MLCANRKYFHMGSAASLQGSIDPTVLCKRASYSHMGGIYLSQLILLKGVQVIFKLSLTKKHIKYIFPQRLNSHSAVGPFCFLCPFIHGLTLAYKQQHVLLASSLLMLCYLMLCKYELPATITAHVNLLVVTASNICWSC